MESGSRIHTSKCHIPLRYLRLPSPDKAQYSFSLLQSAEEFFGRKGEVEEAAAEDTEKTRGIKGRANDSERQEKEGRGEAREGAAEREREEKRCFPFSGEAYIQNALTAGSQTCRRESLCGAAAEDSLANRCSSLPALALKDSRRASVCATPTDHLIFSPLTSVATCEDTPEDNYSLFCEDEKDLEAALEKTAKAQIRPYSLTPSSTASAQIRASQMFSCASTQAAAPPTSQEQHQAPTQQQRPQVQQQEEPEQRPQKPEQKRKEEETPRVQTPRARQDAQWSAKIRGGRGRSRRGGGGSGRRGRHRLQQPLRSYSMLDIENDAFTGVHENDVESEAGQCLRNMKTICGFCLLCFGLFLLLTCPKMKRTSPLTFYYILCTMLAELCIAVCFGCSICVLACLVGEQGAVYANATCGLLHRVAEGIAHYTLTGFGGYLLYNFRALEGEWYASGEGEEEKFLYLLIYVGCEATISLLYSLQTLGTIFGICRFIVIKVYSKLSGRGDVFFLHGDAPIIYASLDQYSHALRRMRNPVEVAYQRRHQHQQPEIHVYSNNGSKDLY